MMIFYGSGHDAKCQTIKYLFTFTLALAAAPFDMRPNARCDAPLVPQLPNFPRKPFRLHASADLQVRPDYNSDTFGGLIFGAKWQKFGAESRIWGNEFMDRNGYKTQS